MERARWAGWWRVACQCLQQFAVMADEEEGLELDGEDGGFQDYDAEEEAATGSGAKG